jgi:hypothetical protein
MTLIKTLKQLFCFHDYTLPVGELYITPNGNGIMKIFCNRCGKETFKNFEKFSDEK